MTISEDYHQAFDTPSIFLSLSADDLKNQTRTCSSSYHQTYKPSKQMPGSYFFPPAKLGGHMCLHVNQPCRPCTGTQPHFIYSGYSGLCSLLNYGTHDFFLFSLVISLLFFFPSPTTLPNQNIKYLSMPKLLLF